MLGIYFSGTGNTQHCIEKLTYLLDKSAKVLSLESEEILCHIKENEIIILGYPTQFSNAPFMVRDFIVSHSEIWKDKKILCVATMGAFSGDGAGCMARLLKKKGAIILGGLHIRMPDSLCDVKSLNKSLDDNKKTVIKADYKIEKTAQKIHNGKYPQDGISFFSHIAGLFGQRLWFYNKTTGYSDQLKINENCIGCGLCTKICPMQNIVVQGKKAISKDRCTMCYRCISQCPQKAITLIGDQVYEQCRFDKYV